MRSGPPRPGPGGRGRQGCELTAWLRAGFRALVLTALLVGLGVAAGLPLGALPDMLLPLAFAATLTAFVFSLLLYLKAQVAPASALAPGGSSGERGPRGPGLEAGGAPACPSPSFVPRQPHLRLLPGAGAQPSHPLL